MLKLHTREEKEEMPPVRLPNEPQCYHPFPKDAYTALSELHKEQLIYTALPSMQRKFNGGLEAVLSLSRDQRFLIYEKIMFGEPVNLGHMVALAQQRIVEERSSRKSMRSRKKDIRSMLALVRKNPKIRAEDLVGELPMDVFARMMLYVKHAGNDSKALSRFLQNELK